MRDTRLDLLPAFDGARDARSGRQRQVWIGDGDRGQVLLKLYADHVPHLIMELEKARVMAMADPLPPGSSWYSAYWPAEGSVPMSQALTEFATANDPIPKGTLTSNVYGHRSSR